LRNVFGKVASPPTLVPRMAKKAPIDYPDATEILLFPRAAFVRQMVRIVLIRDSRKRGILEFGSVA
jgi:hypothetical protein